VTNPRARTIKQCDKHETASGGCRSRGSSVVLVKLQSLARTLEARPRSGLVAFRRASGRVCLNGAWPPFDLCHGHSGQTPGAVPATRGRTASPGHPTCNSRLALGSVADQEPTGLHTGARHGLCVSAARAFGECVWSGCLTAGSGQHGLVMLARVGAAAGRSACGHRRGAVYGTTLQVGGCMPGGKRTGQPTHTRT
jgi:hypothetical protein